MGVCLYLPKVGLSIVLILPSGFVGAVSTASCFHKIGHWVNNYSFLAAVLLLLFLELA